jgi:hypothetical protein
MTDESKQDKTKTPPAWEIFFVGEDGKIIEKPFTNKTTGKTGTSWEQRGALWENETKEGTTFLSGHITLSSGETTKIRCFPPRPKTSK